MTYDYLIVGAGFFGATCARELADAGKRVLVVEKRHHVGGMAATTVVDGITTQRHGGHIFHTNSRAVWEFVRRFGEWREYSHHVKATYGDKVFSFPINLMTLQQIWGEALTPAEARVRLASYKNGRSDESVRDWCLNHIGPELYEMFIEGYTWKQWGRDPASLPASIVRRLPLRLTWNDEYYDAQFQAMPVSGYSAIVKALLAGITLVLGEDFCGRRTFWERQAPRVIYTGPLDALFGYQAGHLEYRSLRFETERIEAPDFQGCATMNYTDRAVPHTRIMEWRHFYPAPHVAHTMITREFPEAHEPGREAYYPVNDTRNTGLHGLYEQLAGQAKNLRWGGRMASYRYLDMDQTIAAARQLVRQELH